MPKESVEKKAPRKKAVRKTPAKKRVSSTATRPVKRKAPTKAVTAEVSSDEIVKKKFPIVLVSIFVVFSSIVGGSVLLGMSDGGEISISSVTREKANQLSAQGDTEAAQKITIPKAETVRRNGGLNSKPETAQPTPTPTPPPVVIASSTATTTDVMDSSATSTQSTTDVDGEGVLEDGMSETSDDSLLDENRATSSEETIAE